MLIALMILLFLCALLAGLYPALFGSRQSPLYLFRGGKTPGGTNYFTRSLLVIQFSLSVMVLIAGIVFTQNAVYQDNIPFGYDKDKIITALIQGPHEAERLTQAIRSNPGSRVFRHRFTILPLSMLRNDPHSWVGEKFKATVYEVGRDYFSTVGLSLLSGRLFNEMDTAERKSVLVDENFVRRNRLADPLGNKCQC